MPPRPAREPGRRQAGGDSAGGDVRALAAEAGRGRHPDREDLQRLLQQAGAGDQQARQALFRAHLDWVLAALDERRERGLGEGDLFQEGTIGLMEAIASFGPAGQPDFERYARGHVAGRMDQALEAETAARRDAEQLVRAAEDYERVEIQFRREHGRRPSDVELAMKLEWSPTRTEEIRRLVEDARRRHDEELLMYLDAAEGETGEEPERP